MKRPLLFLGIAISFLVSCKTTTPVLKSAAYKGMYDEKPLTILLMPPINRSTCVEAKEFFHSTLNVSLANAGFYVLPPFLSMEILKNESAYDAELFLDAPLAKFGEVFGADLALFTIITKWDKSSFASKVYVEVEYILKSTKTNDIVFTRKGNVTYDASVHSYSSSAYSGIVDIAASAVNTATTKYINVARVCNKYTFKDLPAGKYSPFHSLDGNQIAGKKEFKVKLSSKY